MSANGELPLTVKKRNDSGSVMHALYVSPLAQLGFLNTIWNDHPQPLVDPEHCQHILYPNLGILKQVLINRKVYVVHILLP